MLFILNSTVNKHWKFGQILFRFILRFLIWILIINFRICYLFQHIMASVWQRLEIFVISPMGPPLPTRHPILKYLFLAAMTMKMISLQNQTQKSQRIFLLHKGLLKHQILFHMHLQIKGKILVVVVVFKGHLSWEGHNFLRNFHHRFVLYVKVR